MLSSIYFKKLVFNKNFQRVIAVQANYKHAALLLSVMFAGHIVMHRQLVAYNLINKLRFIFKNRMVAANKEMFAKKKKLALSAKPKSILLLEKKYNFLKLIGFILNGTQLMIVK